MVGVASMGVRGWGCVARGAWPGDAWLRLRGWACVGQCGDDAYRPVINGKLVLVPVVWLYSVLVVLV